MISFAVIKYGINELAIDDVYKSILLSYMKLCTESLRILNIRLINTHKYSGGSIFNFDTFHIVYNNISAALEQTKCVICKDSIQNRENVVHQPSYIIDVNLRHYWFKKTNYFIRCGVSILHNRCLSSLGITGLQYLEANMLQFINDNLINIMTYEYISKSGMFKTIYDLRI
jgi:hypothetical protein